MAEKRKEPTKEKSGKPKAPKLSTGERLRRSREVAQGKKNYEALYSFIISVLLFFVALFVLFGGINQRKFLIAVQNMGTTISEFVGHMIKPDSINITDDGVYIDPDKLGENIGEAIEQKENIEEVNNGDTESESSESSNN